IPDNIIISKEIPIDTDKELGEISDDTSDDIKLSTCNTCTKRKHIYVNMKTQTDTIIYTETMIQTTNEYSIFDCINIETQTDNIETMEYKNDLQKLDCAFFKLKPKHIFFSFFEKLKMIALDKFGILEEVVDT
ncbi:7463_t:CDS:2, partial [Racocetra persica]